MISLPQITLVCIDTKNYGKAIYAINKSLEQIKPAKTLFFTDIKIKEPHFETIQIPRIKSRAEYSRFVVKQLLQYINTSHALIVQNDGYVLDSTAWQDEFLKYDYIGSPWLYPDDRNVGNGGFSLRSKRLMSVMQHDTFMDVYHPEDEVIGRLYRGYLEKKYNIKIASEKLAHQFSFELHKPKQKTFGFHGGHHHPYKEKIVIHRSGAMGDVIMAEPILEYYHNKGFEVWLDTPKQFHNLFNTHYFPVRHGRPEENCRSINLDMGYEIRPNQPALKSYYEMCGITDGVMRNSKLRHEIYPQTKFFDKYIVLHIDTTTIPHRDIHGVDWIEIVEYLENKGYKVFQIGKRQHNSVADYFNTCTENLLMHLIAGADLFIGIDSGCAQIAVALDIPSVIYFGSVNPEYRYTDFKKIKIIQNKCPIEKDGCYHKVISVKGQDCEVDIKYPPCCTHDTEEIINSINTFIESEKIKSNGHYHTV